MARSPSYQLRAAARVCACTTRIAGSSANTPQSPDWKNGGENTRDVVLRIGGFPPALGLAACKPRIVLRWCALILGCAGALAACFLEPEPPHMLASGISASTPKTIVPAVIPHDVTSTLKGPV